MRRTGAPLAHEAQTINPTMVGAAKSSTALPWGVALTGRFETRHESLKMEKMEDEDFVFYDQLCVPVCSLISIQLPNQVKVKVKYRYGIKVKI